MEHENDKRRCLGCMSLIDHSETVCPECGYLAKSPTIPSYLTPGIILSERYTVGKLLRYNGEGAEYIGYDYVSDSKVIIREYMPDTLCSRTQPSLSISVKPGKTVQYKAFLSEFIELHKTLAKMRTLSNIASVIDLFAEHNTAYVITEYFHGMKLREYLSECAGELTWEQVKKLFPPIFTTLSLVHNAGIIHRGISPDTIYVTEKGDLKLVGFNTSASRSANSEMAGELFAGYASPEQYSTNEWHGPWTDVYGISAVLYRVLTGSMPTQALSRLSTDGLLEPAQVNRRVPVNISKVIMEGLQIQTKSRIQSVTDLVTKLFEQPGFVSGAATSSMDAVRPPDPARRPPTTPAAKQNELANMRRSRNGQIVASIVGTVAVMAVIIGITILFITDDPEDNLEALGDESTPTQSFTVATPMTTREAQTEDLYSIPDLVGRLYDTIVASSSYNTHITLVATYEFNDAYARGIVFWQSIEANTAVAIGTEMQIKVSQGPQYVEVPEYEGKSKNEYLAELDELGIKYDTKEVESDETPGTVVGVDRFVGSLIDNAVGETLVVKIAVKESD